MRYLVITDIHGNLQALEAVLRDSAGLGYDAVLSLGDLVGYGASPVGVIDRVMEAGGKVCPPTIVGVGVGGTNSSGSTRVTWTWAAYDTSAGSVPSATRKASVSNWLPSNRFLTMSTMP